MGQGKYDFDSVTPDPNRTSVQPIGTDGLAPGAIRTRLTEKQWCDCEKPVIRDSAVKIFRYLEGIGTIELKSCRACGLPIR
jgi:hypothetical protein